MRFTVLIVTLFATYAAAASLEKKQCYPASCDCNESGCSSSSPACCAVSGDPPVLLTADGLVPVAEWELPLLITKGRRESNNCRTFRFGLNKNSLSRELQKKICTHDMLNVFELLLVFLPPLLDHYIVKPTSPAHAKNEHHISPSDIIISRLLNRMEKITGNGVSQVEMSMQPKLCRERLGTAKPAPRPTSDIQR
ncbi:hypothetical protein FB45DRAFT_868477 [Roridomyces roridus]|uniref:Hydrophobin n=1 Tax=Roridomyces roridus TaxID=1738132 RepID=A0AAD7FJ64_9AGAR|nr:hypothetical protein FB45DRAFT_868477 [Roridomyces roridus]